MVWNPGGMGDPKTWHPGVDAGMDALWGVASPTSPLNTMNSPVVQQEDPGALDRMGQDMRNPRWQPNLLMHETPGQQEALDARDPRLKKKTRKQQGNALFGPISRSGE